MTYFDLQVELLTCGLGFTTDERWMKDQIMLSPFTSESKISTLRCREP